MTSFVFGDESSAKPSLTATSVETYALSCASSSKERHGARIEIIVGQGHREALCPRRGAVVEVGFLGSGSAEPLFSNVFPFSC
jgi:hypothetical protein